MKHTILFLAANPLGTDRLALDREARAIQMELERSGFRDRFELVTRWAVEPLDLLRELRKLKPTVLHFSGHGAPGTAAGHSPEPAPRRDVVDDVDHGGEPRHGLYFLRGGPLPGRDSPRASPGRRCRAGESRRRADALCRAARPARPAGQDRPAAKQRRRTGKLAPSVTRPRRRSGRGLQRAAVTEAFQGWSRRARLPIFTKAALLRHLLAVI
jgi:hypothetical protein